MGVVILDRTVPVPEEVLTGELDGLAWYGCDSKAWFPTRKVARWWRRWAQRIYRRRFTVVRCDRCQGFHLTKGKRWRGEECERKRHIATECHTSGVSG